MTDSQTDKIIGRLSAIELVLAQITTLALIPSSDPRSLVADLKKEIDSRLLRLENDNQKTEAKDCSNRILDSALKSATQ